jgi:hypothetical protein
MHDINSAESVPCDPASQPFSQQLFDEIKIRERLVRLGSRLRDRPNKSPGAIRKVPCSGRGLLAQSASYLAIFSSSLAKPVGSSRNGKWAE